MEKKILQAGRQVGVLLSQQYLVTLVYIPWQGKLPGTRSAHKRDHRLRNLVAMVQGTDPRYDARSSPETHPSFC